jgi:hypothetical protein
MKMRQENSEAIQDRKKQKSSEDSEEDIDDNESIESVSDDEFDKYLGKLEDMIWIFNEHRTRILCLI